MTFFTESGFMDYRFFKRASTTGGLILSDKITTNTGSPQGCVLSFILFILYTNSCTSTLPNRHFIKYADDTALVSLLQDEEEEHGPVLDFFINWCKKSKLSLNTTKTKEIAIDYRKHKSFSATFINGEQIQSVTSYKYLGIIMDCDLKWDVWADCISTKAQQRLYFLKKLVSFNVNNKMLLIGFYREYFNLLQHLLVWQCHRDSKKVPQENSDHSQ